MILLVLGVTALSGIKIKKISPIIALRGGLLTHNFKKNRFALDQTRGNLHFLLGFKNIYTNRKQNSWVLLIVTILTFACVFTSVLYYSFAFDKSSIYKLAGAEECDIVILSKEGANISDIFTEVEKMDGVKKTGMLAQKSATINDETLLLYVSDDYSNIVWNTAYKGRQPRYDNEIAIAGALSKTTGKTIGDTIKVTLGQTSKEYLITGLTQQFSDGSTKPASLTLEGYQHLFPTYTQDALSIYLDEHTKNATFIKKLEEQFGNQILIGDIEAAFFSQMSSIITSMTYVTVLVVIMTVLAVSLILYLIIKTMIIKRKRELGIFKAIGYTTFQLMNQITLSFLPVVIVGVVIGGIIGALFTNSILSILFSTLGIYNSVFTVNIPIIIGLSIVIILSAYIVSMLVARRIKHISPHGLMIE